MIYLKLSCIFFLSMLMVSPRAQDLKFSDPVKLDVAINSPSEEINPMLSPDGKRLYFVRAFHKGNTGGAYAGMDIWVSERKNKHQWGPATNKLTNINTKDNNAVVGVRSDHKILYLLNTYNKQGGIGFSKSVSHGWSTPEIINVPDVNRNDFVGFYMSPSYDVLLISMNGEKSYGGEDLYVSLKGTSGKWAKPINLGSTINTQGFEIAPFLSKDKKKLFFSSNGHQGYGDADIFVSERLYDSWTIWSAPRNLGSKINGKGFDAYLTIAEDSTVMFASNRDGDLADLYQCSFLGTKEDAQLALQKSLINEAKDILSELRGESGEEQYFIEFDEQSAEIPAAGKNKLSQLLKDLSYQHYGQIKLVCFEDEDHSSEILNMRINSIVKYLKVSGISEEKITVNRSNVAKEMTSTLADKAGGVLVVVSKTH